MKKKRLMKICVLWISFYFSFFINGSLWAATIYVDSGSPEIDSSWDGQNGHSYIGTPGEGIGYSTVQAAIIAMNPGDHIYLRGGTYQEGHIGIPPSKNGNSWTDGNYNKLSSYPGEWAILDGQNNCAKGTGEDISGVVLGYAVYDNSASYDLKYWWFERIEIKNGRNSDNGHAAAFMAAGGPFKWRYCYIHDNKSSSSGANPGGLKGHHWHDSVIEYCYFDDNGLTSGSDLNAANVLIYTDYNHADTAENGFDDGDTSNRPCARNIIRYNNFSGSSVGFKHKSGQLFSGRNPSGGHGWDDTYNTYGDQIHHNIFQNAALTSILVEQDFCQVYNNITVGDRNSILVQYQPGYQIYKVCIYNNTVVSSSVSGLTRYRSDRFAFEPDEHYGWDYNNIFDGTAAGASWWCADEAFNIVPVGSGGSSACTNDIMNVSSYFATKNYFYRPDSSAVFRLRNVSYTAAGFEEQSATGGDKTTYYNIYDDDNLLFQGTSDANKYKTRRSHVIEGSIKISDGGVGGVHPYLSGVTIPSYVGATNPSDDSWVDGILSDLTSTAWLRSMTANRDGDDNPTWVEGGGGVEGIPPANPKGVTGELH